MESTLLICVFPRKVFICRVHGLGSLYGEIWSFEERLKLVSENRPRLKSGEQGQKDGMTKFDKSLGLKKKR